MSAHGGANAAGEVSAQQSRKRVKSEDDQGASGSGGKILKKSASADPVAAHRQLVLEFVVGGLNPLGAVDEPHFKAMMHGFVKDGNLTLPDRSSISALVNEKVTMAKKGLKEMLRGQAVSLACNTWTSWDQTETTMMALTAHWIDADWELVSACLAVLEVPRSDATPTATLANALLGVLQESSIPRMDVTAVTTDVAVDRSDAIYESTAMAWLPCICRMMDHVMKVMMAEMAELRTKVHKITTEVRETNAVKDRFDEANRIFGRPVRTLPKHSATSWWSTVDSAKAFTENKAAIGAMCSSHHPSTKHVPELTTGEWKVLRDMHVIATPWRELWTELEGEKDIPISTLGIVVDSVFDVLTRAVVDHGLCMKIRRAAGKMKEEMCRRVYRQDDADAEPSEHEARNVLRISRMAAVLDPRMKNVDWASEEDAERNYFGLVESQLQKEIKLEEQRRQIQEAAGQGGGVNGEAPPQANHMEEEAGTGIAALLKKATEAKRRAAEGVGGVGSSSVPNQKRSAVARSVMKEWALYRNEDQVGCTCVRNLGGPRKWWASKEDTYPTLAKLAREYLAVQGSSAPLERLLSVAGVTITEKRRKMGGEQAADIIFLHENMKNKNLW